MWLSHRENKTAKFNKNENLIEAVSMDSDTHRVVAALMDDDSAGKGLVVNFNVERPVSAI